MTKSQVLYAIADVGESFELPSTGGPGVFPVIAVGAVSMIAGVILFAMKKRRRV